MRSLLALFLLSVSMPGQTSVAAPPPPAAPGAAPKSQDTIFTMNGKTWTRGDWDNFIDALPEGTLQTVRNNPSEFIRQLAVVDHLTQRAEKEGFLDREPFKTRHWLERRKMVASFYQEQNQNQVGATDEEVRAFYEKNKDRFTTVSLKMIYLAPPATGSDLAVRAKAETIHQELLKGGDFVKLVKEHSEEPDSKSRDGDLGTVSKSDPLPEEVKAVVFGLKKGDITKPIWVKSGIYLFRCEEAKTEKFEDLKETLRTEVRQRKFVEWFDGERKKAEVKFVREDYLKQ
jgi:parvulin-like peptidyl-prolyl isomerase